MGLRHPVCMHHVLYKCVMPYVYAMSDMNVKLATLKCKSSVSTMTRYIHINKRSVLQCVAVCCSVLQCVAVCCCLMQRGTMTKYVLLYIYIYTALQIMQTQHMDWKKSITHWNTSKHTATHCNTLQHAATHCNTLQHIATHCNTLQHTATHCSAL